MGFFSFLQGLLGGSEGIKGFSPEDEAEVDRRWPSATRCPSGLRFVVDQPGTGKTKPKAGNPIKAHYTGKLLNGKKFDSSLDRGTPLAFKVGIGQVIKGWDEALLDMTQGEKRTLIIPSDLAYGPRGAGRDIPANATLVFEVELVEIS
jgi:peptidylprolyl isomerase